MLRRPSCPSGRPGEGTLLPLWKFFDERVKKKHVTSLCWNSRYTDLFAVGYGSFDYQRQGSGAVCCFSVKNPSHPESYFTTESGVMCLDFHPTFSSLLAVGLYDGSVVVFDVSKKTNIPLYQSTAKTGKHTDPVWQVKWHMDEMSGGKGLQVFSVSSDGRVTLWTMSKSEITYQDAMELKMAPSASDGDELDMAAVGSLAGGCCLDFNRHIDHLFLVGTEEGLIHKCSKAYNSQYLETYRGHHMPVYSVKWNHMHPQARSVGWRPVPSGACGPPLAPADVRPSLPSRPAGVRVRRRGLAGQDLGAHQHPAVPYV